MAVAVGWIVWDELRYAEAYIQTGAFAGHVSLIQHLLAEEPEMKGYLPV